MQLRNQQLQLDVEQQTGSKLGKNPSEEMESQHGQQESEIQYLDAISKTTE